MESHLADYGKQLPVLAEWMRGAKAGHPWGYPIYDRGDAEHVIGEHRDVEAVLAALTAAGPQRLDGKRRVFRAVQSAQELRNLASELSFAARLAQHGIRFDFGAPPTPQPDLVLRELDLGIEVTSRRADPTWDLMWHLKKTFGYTASEPKLLINLEFSAMPFAIRTKVRDELTAEIRRAAQEGEDTVYCVVRPPFGGRPAITVKATITPVQRRVFGFPRVTFTEDINRFRVLMADIEHAIVETMRGKRKVRQAASMPAVLVIDVGRVKGAHLRPTSAWVDRLLQLIGAEDQFLGLGLLHGRNWATDSALTLVRNPHVASDALDDVRSLCRALQLPRRVPRAS